VDAGIRGKVFIAPGLSLLALMGVVACGTDGHESVSANAQEEPRTSLTDVGSSEAPATTGSDEVQVTPEGRLPCVSDGISGSVHGEVDYSSPGAYESAEDAARAFITRGMETAPALPPSDLPDVLARGQAGYQLASTDGGVVSNRLLYSDGDEFLLDVHILAIPAGGFGIEAWTICDDASGRSVFQMHSLDDLGQD
jgi:hypothetical protein